MFGPPVRSRSGDSPLALEVACRQPQPACQVSSVRGCWPLAGVQHSLEPLDGLLQQLVSVVDLPHWLRSRRAPPLRSRAPAARAPEAASTCMHPAAVCAAAAAVRGLPVRAKDLRRSRPVSVPCASAPRRVSPARRRARHAICHRTRWPAPAQLQNCIGPQEWPDKASVTQAGEQQTKATAAAGEW